MNQVNLTQFLAELGGRVPLQKAAQLSHFSSLILFLKYTKNKLLNSDSGEKFKALLAICTSPLGEGEPSCRLPDRWHLLQLCLHKGALLVLCEAFPSDKWCFPVSPYPSKPPNEFDCTLKVHPCHRNELISRGKVRFLLIHIIFFHLSHYLLGFKIPNALGISYWLMTQTFTTHLCTCIKHEKWRGESAHPQIFSALPLNLCGDLLQQMYLVGCHR